MTVDIEVNNTYCKILNHLTIDQLAVVQAECQFKVEGSEYKAAAFKNRSRGGYQWDGYRKLFNIQTRRFPIGLLDRVRKLFNSVSIDVNIINKRTHSNQPPLEYEVSELDQMRLRDYQRGAVQTSALYGNGIVKIATGGGKTMVAGMTIGALNKRSIFIVHTRDLLYQAKETFKRLFPAEKIGQIGDGIIDYQNITVATMQTLARLGKVEVGKNKYDEDNDLSEKEIELTKQRHEEFHKYRQTVECVMMDEVQIVCSQTAYGVRFLFENANYAFGYSASPWRDDGSDLMIEASFGKRIVDITATELINLGYLVKPTIRIHQTHYVVNEIPKTYNEVYKMYIVDNVVRNLQVANDAVQAYKEGNNTLILVTQIKHGEMLRDIIANIGGINVSFISGKSGMKKRRQAIQDMRDGKISLLIASTIADVGLDIPRLQCIVEAGAGKSSVTALQRLGRIMRPFADKKNCTFITYRDKAPYINLHIDKKKEIWQTEPGFEIMEE